MRFTDEEVEHRRVLLRLAGKGNARARKELEQEYHARVYSASQLGRYTPQIEQATPSTEIQRTLDSLLDPDIRGDTLCDT